MACKMTQLNISTTAFVEDLCTEMGKFQMRGIKEGGGTPSSTDQKIQHNKGIDSPQSDLQI